MSSYIYLVLTSQVKARSNIEGNSASAGDTQQVLKSTFNELINEECSITVNIGRYQGVLEHVLSKVNFAIGTDTFIFPSNLNLGIGKTAGCNNKILISTTDMET